MQLLLLILKFAVGLMYVYASLPACTVYIMILRIINNNIIITIAANYMILNFIIAIIINNYNCGLK